MAASAGAADDRHSRAVASAALAAVAPTWLAAGRGARELWAAAVAALPSVPPHRRLVLLGSLLAALPEVSLWFCSFVSCARARARAHPRPLPFSRFAHTAA
jgi:hypothetical protein